MLRLTVALIVFLNYLTAIGQQSHRLTMIVDVRKTDTLKIQKFDESGRLIFWKSFPQYGANQILRYTYSDNRLINYTWSHSKYGFIISEYVYDTISNIRTTYSYEPEDENKDNSINNLMSFQNESDLKNSKQYQEIHQAKNKFLKEIAIYRDTFLIKEIQFSRQGDTTQITSYTYHENLLKDQKLILKNNNAFNEIVYNYDEGGNEIEWMKIFNGTDTSYVFKKKYLNNKIVQEQEFEHGSLQATNKYEYVNDLLKSEKYYDASNYLKKQKEYYYNPDKTISEINDYDRTIYYFYQ